jgi:hypothetical protein
MRGTVSIGLESIVSRASLHLGLQIIVIEASLPQSRLPLSISIHKGGPSPGKD